MASDPRHYFLETSRLGFGVWSIQDADLARALWGDPRVTGLIGGPFNDQQVVERLNAEIASMDRYNVQYWPIFLLDQDQHVGCAGLRPYRVDQRIYELGFHLRPGYWHRGLAREAARAVVAYGFETVGASALFAGHHPDNASSKRILVELGFRQIGEEYYPPTGRKHPSYLLEKDQPHFAPAY